MKTRFPFLTFGSSPNDTPKSEHRAVLEAFLPDQARPDQLPAPINITMAWLQWLTVAIDALITFRSAVHRWQATGQIPLDDFRTEVERLRQAGLTGFLAHLLSVGVIVGVIEEMSDDRSVHPLS